MKTLRAALALFWVVIFCILALNPEIAGRWTAQARAGYLAEVYR